MIHWFVTLRSEKIGYLFSDCSTSLGTKYFRPREVLSFINSFCNIAIKLQDIDSLRKLGIDLLGLIPSNSKFQVLVG